MDHQSRRYDGVLPSHLRVDRVLVHLNLLAPDRLQFDPPMGFVFWLFLSNLIQILLMPLIMVGQNIIGRHAEARTNMIWRSTSKPSRRSKLFSTTLSTETDSHLYVAQAGGGCARNAGERQGLNRGLRLLGRDPPGGLIERAQRPVNRSEPCCLAPATRGRLSVARHSTQDRLPGWIRTLGRTLIPLQRTR